MVTPSNPLAGLVYGIHGLSVRSSLALPGAEPIEPRAPDIEVTTAGFAPLVANLDVQGLRYSCATGKLLIRVDGVANYLIQEGKQIIVAPVEAADPLSVQHFLYGAMFGLMQQRRLLTIRSSAVAKDGRAIMFVGPSGAGKSTMAACLYQRGWRLLSDDFCVVKTSPTAGHYIEKGVAQLRLWPDSLTMIAVSKSNTKPIRKGHSKIAVHVAFESGFMPVPIHRIYMLDSGLVDKISTSPLEDGAAYQTILRPAVVGSYIRGLGLEAIYKQLVMSLVSKVPVVALTRTRRRLLNTQDLLALCETIETDCNR